VTDTWTRYYAASSSEPRGTLLDALGRREAEELGPGLAVDLGCGTGRDTLELLRRGWRVVAVDSEPRAIDALRADPVAREAGGALDTVLASFVEAGWPPADLVNASFSLPFCAPDGFSRTWARIRASLRPGGRFAGNLFGVRDGWAPAEGITFLTRGEVEGLLAGLEVERLDEVEDDGRTALGTPKHWHLFHVIARQR
jgi:SAM-dependent methyltransferase